MQFYKKWGKQIAKLDISDVTSFDSQGKGFQACFFKHVFQQPTSKVLG